MLGLRALWVECACAEGSSCYLWFVYLGCVRGDVDRPPIEAVIGQHDSIEFGVFEAA